MNRKVVFFLFLLSLLLYVSQKAVVQKQFPFSRTLSSKPSPTPPLFDKTKMFADRVLSEGACEDCTTILVTGDVLTARSVNQKNVSLNNFSWPFENTAAELRQADITFINLETPLVTNCPLRSDGMVFCGDRRNVEGLQAAGVDVVTIANNHSGNAQKAGVLETIEVLSAAGMVVTGYDKPAVVTKHGIRFAFVGFNDVEKYGFVADVKNDRIEQDIRLAKQLADIVIVQFHWGEEYRYQPTARQRLLAHQAIDAGADLVLGNHPHWIQPVEEYNDKLIVYSHGNFVFDQMWSKETREGIVGRYTFYQKQLVDVAFFPIFIENYGQPRWMEGKEKARILQLLESESKKLGL